MGDDHDGDGSKGFLQVFSYFAHSLGLMVLDIDFLGIAVAGKNFFPPSPDQAALRKRQSMISQIKPVSRQNWKKHPKSSLCESSGPSLKTGDKSSAIGQPPACTPGNQWVGFIKVTISMPTYNRQKFFLSEVF
jgi:hypothetical protein